MLQNTKLAALYVKLTAAEERQAIERKAVKKAEAKYDRANSARAEIVEQIGEALILQWGTEPDWPILLSEDKPGGSVLYEAREHYIQQIGLYFHGGIWADNREYIVGISINSGDSQAVNRVSKAIKCIAPHIKKVKGGWARFMIAHHDASNSAWEFHYSPKSHKGRLKQMIHGSEHQVLDFDNMDHALEYVRQNLWREDIIDVDNSSVLLLVE